MKTKQENTRRVERSFGMLLAAVGVALVVFNPAVLLLALTAAPLVAATVAPFFM